MNLKSKYFDSIRISKTGSNEVEAQVICDWPDCSEVGSYPAPAAEGSSEKRYFCLEHIRTYNQSFNFFEGMSEADIAAFQRSARTGHRPTWTMGANRNTPGQSGNWQWQDPLDLVSEVSDGKARAPVKRASSGQIRALEVLELDENATAEEVKTRYKARIKKFHPDANNGDRSYEEKLNKVIQAYNYLKASGFC